MPRSGAGALAGGSGQWRMQLAAGFRVGPAPKVAGQRIILCVLPSPRRILPQRAHVPFPFATLLAFVFTRLPACRSDGGLDIRIGRAGPLRAEGWPPV